MTTFSWVLYPHHEYLPVLADEFIAGHFRLRLRGNSLHVEVEAPATEDAGLEARELAERYIKTLAKHLAIRLRLLTIKEFQSLPPIGMTTIRGVRKEQHERIRETIRKARGELLALEDRTLRRCYDYLQDAREHPKESLFYLYKAVEAIEYEFTGARKAIKALGIEAELKLVKKLANEPAGDERHAPKTADTTEHPKTTEKARALESVTCIVRAYEQYLRGRGS